MVKQSLEKQPKHGQTPILSLTSPPKEEIPRAYISLVYHVDMNGEIPPHSDFNSGKSMGFWRLNWLHLTGQSIDWTERIKTCLRSVGGRADGRPDEGINSLNAGRMTRNWVKVFRVNKLE